MRVLVIGGTGFIGHHVADQLVGHAHEAVVVSRDPKRVQHPSYARYRTVLNDLVQMERWLPAELRNIDAVVYCTGATFKLGKPSPNFYFTNVELTKRFFDLVSRFSHIRTVYVSSMSTVAGTKDPTIQRPSFILQSAKGKSLYDATKIMGEGTARNHARKGLDVVIVHPGLTFGPRLDARHDLSSSEIILKFLNGKMPAFVESGHSFCDVRDVAKGIVSALEKGQRGKHYVLGGHNMTLSGFFECLCKCTGRRMPVKIPYRAALGISHLLQVLSCASFKTFKNPFPIGIAKSADLFYFADSQPSIQELGYETRPLKETLRDLIEFAMQNHLIEKKLKFDERAWEEPPEIRSLLDQLIEQHYCAAFLKQHRQCIEDIFSFNHALSEQLQTLYICSGYNVSKKQFKPKRMAKKMHHRIGEFLEYLYFSSNDFLDSVSRSQIHGGT